MTRKSFWILFGIAASIRVFMLWQAQLWYDENFTLILARLPFDRMMQATMGDVHPPLWYLIEWTMYHLLPVLPAWAIRLPALTFSLLAFVMFVRVCNALYIQPRVQLIATGMMAVLPMQVWYAQEGRMYAMLEFLVLAALWTGLKRKWIWFCISAIAMVYLQNYGVFYMAVIGFVLIVLDWKSAKPIIISGSITALFFAPWIFVIVQQMNEISGRYWIVDSSAGAVLKTIYQQIWASSMLRAGIVPSYVITFAALIIGLYTMMKEIYRTWWPVLVLAFAPFGIAWLVSVTWQPVLLFRALIGTSPFLYLIVAWPFGEMTRSKRVYTFMLAFPLCVLGIGGYFINIGNMKGEAAVLPLLTAVDYVRAHWQDGDVLYFTDDGPMVNIMPYAADLPQYRMPDCQPKTGYSTLGSLSDKTRIAIGAQIADLDDVPYKRAWVFAPRSPLHPLCYESQIENIAAGDPLILVDKNEYMMSGVWLVEK